MHGWILIKATFNFFIWHCKESDLAQSQAILQISVLTAVSCPSSHLKSSVPCLLSDYGPQPDPFRSLGTELLSQHPPTSVAPPAPAPTSWHCFPGQGFSNIRLACLIIKKKKRENIFSETWCPPSPCKGSASPHCLKEMRSWHFCHPTPVSTPAETTSAAAITGGLRQLKAISTLSREEYQVLNTTNTCTKLVI